MTRVFTILLSVGLLAGRAEAQGLSPAVKYGKWILLAGSIGMNYLAFQAHDQADKAFDDLETRCLQTHARCAVGTEGAYTDPEIESLFQTSLRYDRRARRWLIGGETALAGAAALFVWELARPKRRPGNIPFEPEVRSLRQATGLGLRMAF